MSEAELATIGAMKRSGGFVSRMAEAYIYADLRQHAKVARYKLHDVFEEKARAALEAARKVQS